MDYTGEFIWQTFAKKMFSEVAESPKARKPSHNHSALRGKGEGKREKEGEREKGEGKESLMEDNEWPLHSIRKVAVDGDA